MNRFFAVAIGGSVGTLLRFYIQNWSLGRFGAVFPYGTVIVNVAGSFMVGLLMTIFLHHIHIAPAWRVFWVTGCLGGFTTFSAFGWETYALFAKGEILHSLLYIGTSLGGGMAALLLGVILGRLVL